MANRNFPSAGKIYSGHVMPVLLDANFIVDADNSNGLGIRALKGPMINAVYMHCSVTPATLNPNPQNGVIVVQLADNFNKMLYSARASISSPLSGSDVKIDNSAMTAGVAYTITTLGNASAAKWIAIGVPRGITAAVGVSFIAASNGGAGNTLTSRVQAVASSSTVASIEVVGDPDTMIAPVPSANQGYGASIILICRDYAGAIVAPADEIKIGLQFYLSNSSITVQGG